MNMDVGKGDNVSDNDYMVRGQTNQQIDKKCCSANTDDIINMLVTVIALVPLRRTDS